MTKEELIKGLTECGVKKKEIEEKLGMPKNSLSGMISGSKPIPEKWFVLLEGFLSGNVAEVGSEIKPKSEVLINDELELQKFASQVSINSALKQIEKEEETTFQGFIELVNPQPEPVTFGIIPRTEEAVLIPEEMPNSHIKVPEKVVFGKAAFKELLTEFNLLIDNQAPIKQVEGKLYELIEKSQHHDLNARQSEAIRSRCINYLTGQYGKKKPTN